ncbi:hypothetical protein J2X54_002472 [Duganella sp. 3397]|uniref:PKD domain-containing protein n=1 Tax=Duganella sp. 3397 TaxID=2817732 RepID=UPI00285D32DE|nr:Ig-like domain-containing protein [Duganella sp. 3397]MDR7050017.1 hypothetical protein [Duganella sp. 3397]
MTLVAEAGAPSLGAEVSLTGAASTDPEGAALIYAWILQSKPGGSNVSLPASTASSLKFTPDFVGNYVVRLRVTDREGLTSEQDLTVTVANRVPVAIIDKPAVTVLAGGGASISGSLSYDEDGDPLTYAWSIDSRPSGSTMTLANATAATLNFAPDAPGNYTLLLKVSDGKRPVTARVDVKVLAQLSGFAQLPFTPLAAKYSKTLDKVIMVSSGPDALRIGDPFTGQIKSVVLPGIYKALSISPDGKLAAVLHEAQVTLVDLQTAATLRTSPTGGSQTEVMLTDAGVVYLIGQSGGQWNTPSVTVLNARTGVSIPESGSSGYGRFYGTMHGVYSQLNNKGYAASEGVSPVDISYFTTDATSKAVNGYGDSPYHGDYPMSSTLFLSANEDLVITGMGTYFRTDTLQYAGRLALTGTSSWANSIVALSQSSTQETLVIEGKYDYYYPAGYAWTYPATYRRYTGQQMQFASDLNFPLIDGQVSYGRQVFHSAAGNHVAVVQTGGAMDNVNGLKFYMIYR